MKTAQLTLKQQMFLKAYMSCFNATQAAREAGYAEKHLNKYASSLLSNPLIKTEIDKYRQKIDKRSLVTFDETVKLLWDMANEAREDGDRDVVVKSIAEINKMFGRYAPERTQSENINVTATVAEVKEIQEARLSYKKEI